MIYSPDFFIIKEESVILDFIQKVSFASLLSCKDSSIEHLTKLPLNPIKEDNQIILEGHFARANPHWKYLKTSPQLSIMFDGPHDYISPTWYENTEKSVPTWNYMTAILEGRAEIIDSSEWLLESITNFSDRFEVNSQWKDTVDKKFLSNLSKAIIGIKIVVEKTHCKFKLSQQQKEQDRSNVIRELEKRNVELAGYMQTISL